MFVSILSLIAEKLQLREPGPILEEIRWMQTSHCIGLKENQRLSRLHLFAFCEEDCKQSE
jgi:hypothetical protein